ncbi:MAG: helicase-related protein [Planctomycetota bacterium]
MSIKSPIVHKDLASFPACVLREFEEFGFASADVVYPPRRLLADQQAQVPIVEVSVDANRLRRLPTPTQLLDNALPDDNWMALSRRSLARLRAFFLVVEDPQRRLDAREVSTLSHQVSLVRHVLESEKLTRVLIADEVGLGKTVEAGLLISQLLEQNAGLRVLYLAPARLVNNVRREFERLNLPFRQWSAIDADARLTDTRVIASIHRAVHPRHYQAVVNSNVWDVVIVDECHHLSDWGVGGGDPREKFKLVRDVIKKQPENGRVIFLSGTPHQGNVSRFENLLGLLQGPNETAEAMRGRVIYRTKEDVRDWNGKPLFPKRQVNEPMVIDLGPIYRAWVQAIHDFYRPPKENRKPGEAQKRAAGWRLAQALQWAVSSPQAGLGYLVRQALRAGLDLGSKPLESAIGALRPYRTGKADEPIPTLYERIVKEVTKQKDSADVEDIEDDVAEEKEIQKEALENLLTEGISVIRESGDHKWRAIKEKLLDPAGTEKIVLFAQPIETVTSLANFLKKLTGKAPAMIVGGQTDDERQKEVDNFWKPDGPQFLVSSRAGGEGINLQVSRRLIHIDVPWNPMDLEQRVGRVHRFGSRQTILVDTVVVKDSREAQAYRIARERLRLITATLVKDEKFEAVFARVMCLLPPEGLQDVLLQESFGPIRPEGQEQIARMVQEGFQNWSEFHDKFAERQQQIRLEDPGLAKWKDVERFLLDHAEAQQREGFSAQRFAEQDGQFVAADEAVSVLKMPDGNSYFCDDTGGAPVFGPDGQKAKQIGLNMKPVADLLRKLAFPPLPSGGAFLRWSKDAPVPQTSTFPFGVLVFLRQTVKPDHRVGYVELAASLHTYIIASDGTKNEIVGKEKAAILDGLIRSAPLRNKPETPELLERLKQRESELAGNLCKPAETEFRAGIRYAVTPLLAAIVVE